LIVRVLGSFAVEAQARQMAPNWRHRGVVPTAWIEQSVQSVSTLDSVAPLRVMEVECLVVEDAEGASNHQCLWVGSQERR
jgi:hypothetical protein